MTDSKPAPETSRDQGDSKPRKRAYRRPELVEYGSIAKLTQGSRSTMNEGVGFNMMCL